MPYYTKRMVRYLQGKDGKHQKTREKGGRALRTTPSSVGKSGAAVPQPEAGPTPATETVPDQSFDQKKLLYMKGLLKSEVERINQQRCAFPAKGRHWNRYSILADEGVISESAICKVFKAKHSDYKENVLAVKAYEGEHGIDVKNSLYLKILRHLGKKQPNIIQTWDMFADESNKLWIFQELANRGSVAKYLENNNVDESQVGRWSWQINKALDYLGDVGITHRGINPKHILITHKQLKAKLSGFENSTIYWDLTKEDIKNIPCLPLDSRPTDASYQAPEVYGNQEKEEYDPIVADVWSFGATIFHMLTKSYPYDYQNPEQDIGQQIQTNVEAIAGLSPDGKKLLNEMLKINANQRIHIDKLATDSWLKQYK
jgi:serine/threonine protein kinase